MNYSAKVMDHFSNPRNVGEIENPSAVGEVGNAVCGDIMKIYLKIENNIITDVKFKTFGCGAAVATSSMATELIKGKSVDEALTLTNKAVIEALDGLPLPRYIVPYLQRRLLKPLSPTIIRKTESTKKFRFMAQLVTATAPPAEVTEYKRRFLSVRSAAFYSGNQKGDFRL